MAALFNSSNDAGAGAGSGFGTSDFGGAPAPTNLDAGAANAGAVPSSSASTSGAAGGAPAGEKPTFAEKETEFEDMVGDMRNAFISWLRKTESQLQDAKLDLIREKEGFEEEKSRVWRQFMQEKQQE